jgi:hypothetical protein
MNNNILFLFGTETKKYKCYYIKGISTKIFQN